VIRIALLLALSLSLGCHAQEARIDPLWATTLTGLDDKPVAMDQFRGRPLAVNFWARWCTPCRDEIPDFVRARAKFKAKGIEVVGIAIEDKAGPVAEFAKAYDMSYPVIMAGDKGIALMQAMGNKRAGLPFTVVVDRQGQIVASKLGPMKMPEIEAALTAATR
jgi:thiol-disulfide isomerase/thioredoxin